MVSANSKSLDLIGSESTRNSAEYEYESIPARDTDRLVFISDFECVKSLPTPKEAMPSAEEALGAEM